MNILEIPRRFIMVSALGLWLGGFTVYTAFVIRIGHRQIPGGRFGFVTGEVTSILEILAGVAALAGALNLALGWSRLGRGGRWWGGTSLLAMAGALVGSHLLHAQLDAVLVYPTHEITDQGRFDLLHERYELVATLAWAAGLVHLWVVLWGWRKHDRATAATGG